MAGVATEDEEYVFLLGYMCALDQMLNKFKKKINSHPSTQKDWHRLQFHQVGRVHSHWRVNRKWWYECTQSTQAC